jgi:hypothetical protein
MSRLIDKNSSHGLGRSAKEMAATAPVLLITIV